MNRTQTRNPQTQRRRGFSLLELMVAMSLGLLLLGAATQLFKAGMTTSSLVSNRSEMQQNVRVALDLVSKDISMAGAGLPPGGIQLPTGANSTLSKIGCNQPGFCYLANTNYATGTVGVAPPTVLTNYLFGVIPGPKNGMERFGPTSVATSVPAINSSVTGIVPDSITVTYVDFAPQFNLFHGMFVDNTGTALALTPPIPFPSTLLPATDAGTGIKAGDLLLVTTNSGTAIGEVSTVAPFLTTGATVTFANLDPLNINQSGAASNNMKSIVVAGSFPLPWIAPPGGSPTVTVQRLLVISYFLEVPPSGAPRLMRQVNGNLAQPVADNILNLQLSYDLCDTGNLGGTCATTADPIAAAQSPSQIHKVNVQIMGQSLVNSSQSMLLSSAVSTRNLSFKDRYK
jgi:prepilin-type N-terminal cleavage/methylation domain-containing protein